jgi:hypothetical protein
MRRFIDPMDLSVRWDQRALNLSKALDTNVGKIPAPDHKEKDQPTHALP